VINIKPIKKTRMKLLLLFNGSTLETSNNANLLFLAVFLFFFLAAMTFLVCIIFLIFKDIQKTKKQINNGSKRPVKAA